MGKALAANVGAAGTPPQGDRANAVVTGVFSGVGPGKPFCFQGPFNLAIYASVNTALTTTNGSNAFTVASGTGLAAGDAISSVNVPPGTTMATLVAAAGTLAFPTISQNANISPSTANITGVLQTAGLVGSAVAGPGIAAGTTVIAIVQPAAIGNSAVPTIPGILQLSAAPTLLQNGAPLTFALTNNSVTTGTDAAAIITGAAVDYVSSVQLERSFDGGNTWIVCGIGGQGALAQWAAGTPVSCVVGEAEAGVAYRLNCTAYTSGVINYRLSTTGAAALSLSLASAI